MQNTREKTNTELKELRRQYMLSKVDEAMWINKYEMEHTKWIVTFICMIVEAIIIGLLV